MVLNEEKLILKTKIEDLEKKTLDSQDMSEEFGITDNTKLTRNRYMRLLHYYHILSQMGEGNANNDKENMTFSLLKDKILKITNKNVQERELVQINLVNAHTNAFTLAEHFYEKSSKSLCQMMITLMDYILQEKNNISLLYTADIEEYRNFPSLLEEIKSLNRVYLDSYFFLCAYDYCSEKLSDYMDIKEYKNLTKEHTRIIENGIPQRVSRTISFLKDVVKNDKAKSEIMQDIELAYTPEPPYKEDILKNCYQEVLMNKYNNNIDLAMSEFRNFVISVDNTYEKYFGEGELT
jgi:hypothetical protein